MVRSDCLFCRIIDGVEPAHIVGRDEHTVSFLDTTPLFHGHTLVVPIEHHETFADLPKELLPPLFGTAQALSQAMEICLGAAGSFVAMNNRVSQSVAHLHVHVSPRNFKDGLRGFFWPRHRYESEAQMAQYAAKLASAIGSGPAT